MAPFEIELDDSQSFACRALFGGKNVALVGPAGCGKSVVLRAVMTETRRRFGEDAVLALAWSGTAAQLVGGCTVASVLRTTVGDPSKETILRRVTGDRHSLNMVKKAKVVVIDEAPTIEGRWMDRLEYVLRRTAPTLIDECKPFGGRRVLGKLFLVFPFLVCFLLYRWRCPLGYQNMLSVPASNSHVVCLILLPSAS